LPSYHQHGGGIRVKSTQCQASLVSLLVIVLCSECRGVNLSPGASIHRETMMHFLPVPDFPPIFDSVKNFQNVTFSRKLHFPLFRENYYSPTFRNVPPILEKSTCFLHTLCVFRFPPTLIMMHLGITQCTYWTPLLEP